ncbi:hypothetical protein REPUB_Repub09cG0045000 [Reevesia pubescens]
MADTPTQTQEPPQVVFVMIHVGGGDDNKIGQPPASKASIEAMPRIKVNGSGNDCSICLEEYKVDEEAREMPCKHVFHSSCVEKWLRIHGSCPVCRFLMPTEEAQSGGAGGDGGLGSLEGVEIGLGFLQSVLAVASLASLMAMAGSGRGSQHSGSGQFDGDDSSAQDMDSN